MKKNLLYGLMSTALVLSVATACSDDKDQPGSQSGTLDLTVDLDVNALNASEGERSRATADEITVDDLALTLTPKSGGQSRTWASINDFDKTEQFPVGDYTLAVSYGDPDVEGFDRPYYYGSTDFRIREDQTTPVAVTAALANAMVKVEASDAFKSYFTEAAFTIQSNNGAVIDYPLEETESAYFKAGEVNVIANVTKPNGVSGSLTVATFEAQPRYSYTVKADINGGAGDATLVISYNDATESVVVEIDLTDELLNAPAPEVNAKGFDPQETYTIVDGLPEGLSPVLDIIARNGLAGIAVTTQSPSLIAAGWPAEIDLMKADAAQQQLLEGLGLKARGVYRNPDKLAVVDLSGVVNNIYYVADASTDNKITVVAKDKLGKLAEPVTLSITTLPIELLIQQPTDAVTAFDTEVTIPVSYNGSNINNVEFYIKNPRGTFDKISGVVFSAVSTGQYNAIIPIEASSKDVVVYAKCKGATTPAVTITKVATVETNAFAKYAYINVGSLPGATADISAAKIQLASTGSYTDVNFTEATDGYVKIDGLSANSDYRMKIFYNDKLIAATRFETEAPTQLDNSGMENWATGNSGNNWQEKFAGTSTTTVWGTNNSMTTSEGSNLAYCRISGTIDTSDGHTGTAALIRTVGWGSGNTASGSVTTGVMKYADAGLLHLGATRTSRPSGFSDRAGSLNTDDLNPGIAFSSRPSALTFWYKYSPKNSADKGFAEIWVKDATGQILAAKSIDLGSTGTYTQVTLPLDYSSSAAKAAKIYVRFQSTNDTSYLVKSSSNFSAPNFGNLSNGTYLGSQLYVDDIELVY